MFVATRLPLNSTSLLVYGSATSENVDKKIIITNSRAIQIQLQFYDLSIIGDYRVLPRDMSQAGVMAVVVTTASANYNIFVKIIKSKSKTYGTELR